MMQDNEALNHVIDAENRSREAVPGRSATYCTAHAANETSIDLEKRRSDLDDIYL